MNVFELAKLLSPLGGVAGGAMAAHRGLPAAPAWMLAGILVGLACGIGCYPGLIRLAIGRHDRNPDIPGYRLAAILGIALFAPFIAGTFSYGLVSLLLYVVA